MDSYQQELIVLKTPQQHYYQCGFAMDFNSEKQPFRKIQQLVKSLLPKYIPGYIPQEIEVKLLCGTTNEVFKITPQNQTPVVFRVLSPVVDREREGRIVLELSRAGVAPKCFFTCLEYRLEEYVENARHCTPVEIIETPTILRAIIEKVNAFHQVQLPETISRQVTSIQIFSEQSINKYMNAQPYPGYNITQFEQLKTNLLKEHAGMKQWVASNFGQMEEKIKLCHNDLNNLNIFVRDHSQNQTEAILIDFDYVGYNYIAYDLANFLNETCFSYGGDYPGFKLHRKLAKPQIYKAASYYGSRYKGLQQDIIKMLVLVNYYWALWSIVIKPTGNFCPLKHGVARWELLNEYRKQCSQQ